MATQAQQATYTVPMSTTEMRLDYAQVIRQAHRNALARKAA
ncbi:MULTISPECIES: hypothetical protein [Haloferax]|nr:MULTISPECIES: hypothetical protein [Haloferax]